MKEDFIVKSLKKIKTKDISKGDFSFFLFFCNLIMMELWALKKSFAAEHNVK